MSAVKMFIAAFLSESLILTFPARLSSLCFHVAAVLIENRGNQCEETPRLEPVVLSHHAKRLRVRHSDNMAHCGLSGSHRSPRECLSTGICTENMLQKDSKIELLYARRRWVGELGVLQSIIDKVLNSTVLDSAVVRDSCLKLCVMECSPDKKRRTGQDKRLVSALVRTDKSTLCIWIQFLLTFYNHIVIFISK